MHLDDDDFAGWLTPADHRWVGGCTVAGIAFWSAVAYWAWAAFH